MPLPLILPAPFSSHTSSSFWCRRLAENEVIMIVEPRERLWEWRGGKHIAVVIMCRSQAWEMLRKQSGAVVISVLSLVLQCVTVRDIHIAEPGKWKQASCGSHRKWKYFHPPRGIESYVQNDIFNSPNEMIKKPATCSQTEIMKGKKMNPRKEERLHSCW